MRSFTRLRYLSFCIFAFTSIVTYRSGSLLADECTPYQWNNWCCTSQYYCELGNFGSAIYRQEDRSQGAGMYFNFDEAVGSTCVVGGFSSWVYSQCNVLCEWGVHNVWASSDTCVGDCTCEEFGPPPPF